jgi:hypothetical protein
MDNTGFWTGQSIHPLFALCLRCDQGAQARAQPYDIGRITHSIVSKNSRLPLLCLIIH